MTAPRLSNETLSQLPGAIAGLSYDRGRLKAGIVHIGPGAFHRAHMARYVHALMSKGQAMDWAIVGAGMTPFDTTVHNALAPQDWLYTLVERDDDSASAQVVGSIIDIVKPGDVEAILSRIDRPGVRIVSLTISENGYCLGTESRRLDPAHPAVVADLAHPRRPTSAIGLLVEAYRRRRASGRPAFTALSCDNLPGNGRLLQAAVLELADLIEPELAAWIAANGRFPGTMVDRITPVTRADDVVDFPGTYGVTDHWPIYCEPFTQWVIEDDFADGRPGWETVGVQFTDNVEPFEKMKLRLLNTSHLALASLGFLLGHKMVSDAMRDSRLDGFIRALMVNETAPTLMTPPPIDLGAYQDQVVERFSKATLRDTIERINTDASLSLLLDPIRDRLALGLPVHRLCLAVAAWIRRLELLPAQELAVRHPLAEDLRAAARSGGPDPAQVLAVGDVFGDLRHETAFVALLAKWLEALRHNPASAIELAVSL